MRTVARYDDALETLNRAATTHRAADDLEGLARTAAQIEHVHGDRGTPDAGVAWLTPVIAALKAQAPHGMARHSLAALYGALAYLAGVSGCYVQERDAAERAMELARAVGDDRIAAEAALMHGLVLNALGLAAEGLHVLLAATRLAEAVGDLHTLCYAHTQPVWSMKSRASLGRAGSTVSVPSRSRSGVVIWPNWRTRPHGAA